MKIQSSLMTFAGLIFALGSQAHEPAASRYRVIELPIPDSLKAGCLSGYAAGASITRINDFGIVNGVSLCYTAVDPATATVQLLNRTFIASSWFGATELPLDSPTFSYSYGINDRGESSATRGGRPAASTPRDGRLAADTSAFSSTRPANRSSFRRG